jgi:MFS family permease
MTAGNQTQDQEQTQDGDRHWRRNLAVCLVGSVINITAMTLLLPFLPLYVEQLGVTDHVGIAQWSGIAYGATFFAAALVAPLWGRLADRYGRKAMLIRASLGLAVAMPLIGMAHNVWELVGLRLFAGFAGGYTSGSTILVATHTPRERSGWALGMLSSGMMAGSLVGPLVGGVLPQLITFLATTFLIKEEKRPTAKHKAAAQGGWSSLPDKRPVIAMLATGLLLMIANMSIEPIITLYVAQIVDDPAKVTLVSGITMSAAALGSILSASRLGRLADRIGHWSVIIGALAVSALLLIPQAFVTQGWQLVVLRFLMGLALGGLLPCVTSVIRHNVPYGVAGAILGYATSSQYAGQVVGPLLGGFVGGHIGMRAVFLGTAVLMAAGAAYAWMSRTDRVVEVVKPQGS